MLGSPLDRAERICRDIQRFGAEAVVVSRIPGASHCGLEGLVIGGIGTLIENVDTLRERLGVLAGTLEALSTESRQTLSRLGQKTLSPQAFGRALEQLPAQDVRTLEKYLRAREANWGWWERSALQHRASMKSLYALTHVKPSAMAQQIHECRRTKECPRQPIQMYHGLGSRKLTRAPAESEDGGLRPGSFSPASLHQSLRPVARRGGSDLGEPAEAVVSL